MDTFGPQHSTRTVYGAAIALGVFVALLTAVILFIGLYLLHAGSAAWRWLLLSPLAGLSATGLYGIRWTIGFAAQEGLHFVVPPARSAPANPTMTTPPTAEAATTEATPTGERLETVLLKILDLHYNDCREATRPECEAAGVTQSEWNTANAVLKALHIKSERSWHNEYDYVAARRIMSTCFRVDAGGAVWISNGNPTYPSWARLQYV